MPKDETSDRRDRETRGGYPAGGKPISEFPAPPPGPAPGGKRLDGGADPSPEK
jgi:hypothetical protein